MSDSHSTLSRDFKGIWIPKEIWLHPNLSLFEKLLWAEIDSFYSPHLGGCNLSNENLATNFNGVKSNTISKAISKLKKLGLIESVSFDGRVRVIKAISKERKSHE